MIFKDLLFIQTPKPRELFPKNDYFCTPGVLEQIFPLKTRYPKFHWILIVSLRVLARKSKTVMIESKVNTQTIKFFFIAKIKSNILLKDLRPKYENWPKKGRHTRADERQITTVSSE